MSSKNKPEPIDPSLFVDPMGGEDYKGDATDTPETGFVIDFAKVPDISAPVPAGQYDATIVKAEAGISKAGNPMIKLRWRIDDDGEYYHRQIFDNLVFTETALWRVRQFLAAIGYASDFKGEINPENLLGESAIIALTIQAGEGINPETQEPYPPRNSISKVLPLGSRRTVDDLL